VVARTSKSLLPKALFLFFWKQESGFLCFHSLFSCVSEAIIKRTGAILASIIIVLINMEASPKPRGCSLAVGCLCSVMHMPGEARVLPKRHTPEACA
jgi:hypothetical protein